jgi:hypothetical protein
MSALDAQLAKMGISGPPPAHMAVAVEQKKAPPVLTKKQKEALAAKEKEEKKRKKIAAAMFKAEGGDKKADKKDKSKPGAAEEAASREATTAGAASASTAAPVKQPKRAKGPTILTDAERQRAMEAARAKNEEAERAFAVAYECTSAIPSKVVPIDYHVRSAAELYEARSLALAAREVEAATRARATATEEASRATAKPGCLVSQEEWALLQLAAGQA